MKRAPILVAVLLALAATMGLAGSPADAGDFHGGPSVVRAGGSFVGHSVPIQSAIKDPIVPHGFFSLPPPPPHRRFPRGFAPVGVIASPVIIVTAPPDMYGTPGYDSDPGYYYAPDGPPATYYPSAAYIAPSYPPAAYSPPPAPYPGSGYYQPAASDAPPVSYPPMGYNPPPGAYPSAGYNPAPGSYPPAGYNPTPVSAQPVDRTVTLMPSPPSSPNVVQYPTGRYELRGDGTSSPYSWVWLPNPPPPPPPPGPPPAGPAFSGDPSYSRRSQLYRWTDEQGVVHLTDRLEGVPPQYRGPAKQAPSS